MTIDRKRFFVKARANPFNGMLTQGQVDGCNAILDTWEKQEGEKDKRWLAYMLATAKWETAHTMQPIEEYGKGEGHDYGEPDPETGQTYYGRGYVQLTWRDNYEKMQTLLGLPLVADPGLALQPQTAAAIMFKGMEQGIFTGAGLPRYFSATADDALNARRIVNGTDHAHDIANIYYGFWSALT